MALITLFCDDAAVLQPNNTLLNISGIPEWRLAETKDRKKMNIFPVISTFFFLHIQQHTGWNPHYSIYKSRTRMLRCLDRRCFLNWIRLAFKRKFRSWRRQRTKGVAEGGRWGASDSITATNAQKHHHPPIFFFFADMAMLSFQGCQTLKNISHRCTHTPTDDCAHPHCSKTFYKQNVWKTLIDTRGCCCAWRLLICSRSPTNTLPY